MPLVGARGHHLLVARPHDHRTEREGRVPPRLLDRQPHEPLVGRHRDGVEVDRLGWRHAQAPSDWPSPEASPFSRPPATCDILRPMPSQPALPLDDWPPGFRHLARLCRPRPRRPAGRGAGRGRGGRLVPADHAPLRPPDVGHHVQSRAPGLGHRPRRATATSRTIPPPAAPGRRSRRPCWRSGPRSPATPPHPRPAWSTSTAPAPGWACTRTATRPTSPPRSLSVSLGDDALFRLGGTSAPGPDPLAPPAQRRRGGAGRAARLSFHGIDRVLPGTSDLVPGGGRINLTLRRVTVPPGPGGAGRASRRRMSAAPARASPRAARWIHATANQWSPVTQPGCRPNIRSRTMVRSGSAGSRLASRG